MGRVGKYILAAILLLSLASTVSALTFSRTIEQVQNQIYLDENAIFTVSITNPGDQDEIYEIYTTHLGWIIDFDPALVRLAPHETENVTLELFPSAYASTGPQIVPIVIEGINTRNRKEERVSIYVKDWSLKGRKYAPSIELRVDSPDKVDPRNNFPVDIYIRNRNRLEIEELQIIIKSKTLDKEYGIPFAGLEERTEGHIFSFDPLTPPQKDTLTVSLVLGNETINEVKKTFDITGYSDFVEETDVKHEFFKTIEDTTVTNKGNYERTEQKRVPVTFMERLFSGTTPKAQMQSIEGDTYYVWSLTLAPEQQIKLQRVTNFRPIFYLMILSILGVLAYFVLRSPVLAKKEVLVIGPSTQGISEMKVIVYLKNRTSDIINNISITDKVPSIAELIRESYLGTLEPSKILTHDKKGTIVKWEIRSLEPFEERVITYRIKSKLGIFGGVSLPPVKITFDTTSGKERMIHSNRCELSLKH